MNINLSIEMADEATAADVAEAIRDAAERASAQIETGVLRYPLEVDNTILLGSDGAAVVDASLFRTE